jgi:CHAT domain-containing protein/Tfp pilus assembly protein PilF
VGVLVCLALLAPRAPVPGQTKEAVDEVNSLWRKAFDLNKKGKPAEAAKTYEVALAKAEKAYGKAHTTTATLLNNLAVIYNAMGECAKAEPLLKRSLAIQEAKLGKGHPGVATCLISLADLYTTTGRYAEAEPLYRRGLAIREAKLGKGHPNVADCLLRLAYLYSRLGQHTKADAQRRRGLEILEAKLREDHPEVAASLPDLIDLYSSPGADAPDRRGLKDRDAKQGKGHPDVADSLTRLADLYSWLGENGKAEALHRRGLAIREARLGKDHPQVADSLNRLAELYSWLERNGDAEEFYRRGLAIREAALGKDHPDVAGSLHGLAILYDKLGKYTEAEALYRRGLTAREARLGKDHPEVAKSLIRLADLHFRRGQYAEAEPLYRRGLAIREATLGKDHPDVAESLNTLAFLQVGQGQAKGAADLFDRARRGSRHHVSSVLPALAPREQAGFLCLAERWRFAEALSLALWNKEDPGLAARSASWLLNGKAVAQEALAQSALLSRDSRDPTLSRLAGQLREARAELARATLAMPPAGKEKAHRGRIETLAGHEQGLAEKLAADGGAAIGSAGWIGLDSLRKSLPADAVLIDIARFCPWGFNTRKWQYARYLAWVTPARGDVRLVNLGPADAIDAAVTRVRQALEQAAKLIGQKGEPEAEKALRTSLEALSKLVLQPLLPHAGESQRWVVSPDGNLWLIPWEILLLPDGKYAIEKHTLSYALSGRDLVSAPRHKGRSGRPLVVADPDFDLDANAARAETARLLPGKRDTDELRGLSGLLRLGSIRRLPGTLAEAKAIQGPLAAYTKQAPRQLLGKQALEGLVKGARGPRVLVLATHGFFLPEQTFNRPSAGAGDDQAQLPPGWENPLLRCGLLLAGCNDAAKAADGDDGVLTGLEIVGMDLRGCEMVVLSACETGLGDVQNGEGVAGLRQAFRLAGADSVVSTLWQVPDKSSSQLMTLFFHGLAKGKDRASALREAQLRLIEQRREDGAAAHPFFWAAFTVTGR